VVTTDEKEELWQSEDRRCHARLPPPYYYARLQHRQISRREKSALISILTLTKRKLQGSEARRPNVELRESEAVPRNTSSAATDVVLVK